MNGKSGAITFPIFVIIVCINFTWSKFILGKFFKYFICFLFCIFFLKYKSQKSSFYQINEVQGLPSNEVYQLIQDDLGYIYIGCSEGVFKYDGFKFLNISNPLQNAKSVSNFIKDSKGRIWCQNFAGQVYLIANDSLKIFRDFSNSDVDFPQFVIDDSLAIWIGLKHNLIKTSEKEKSMHYPFSADENYRLMFIHSAGDHLIYSILNKGIYLFHKQKHKEKLLSDGAIFKERANAISFKKAIYMLFESNPEKSYDLFVWEKNNLKHLTHIEPNRLAREIYQVRPTVDGFWISTSNGAYYFKRDDFSVPLKHLFKGKEISSSIEDKEGNVWFSSLSGGIYITSPKSAIIHEVEEGDSKPFISMYVHPDCGLFVGDIEGAVYHAPDFKAPVLVNEKREEGWRRLNKMFIYGNQFYAARNYLTFSDVKGNNRSVKTNYIRDMAYFNNRIYLITSVNFGYYDIRFNKFELISGISARKIVADTLRQTIYLSTGKGVYQYKDNEFKDLLWDNKPLHVSSMAFSNGILWLNTLKNGVIGFKNGKFHRHYFKNESVHNRIKCITAANENLYLITEKGVIKINDSSGIKQFIGNSLQVNFQGITDCQIVKNTMYLLSSKAVYSFPLQYFGARGKGPDIHIVKVMSRNGEQVDTSMHFFSNRQNSFELYFKAFSYRSQGNLRYIYRLLGSADDWKELQPGVDHILFESLPAGTYTFEVKAINGDGDVSEYAAKYTFTIDAPLFRKPWFIAICFLFVVVILFMVFKWKLNRERKKAVLEKAIAESKLTALKAQMNPHFMFNALNSIQDLILKQDIKSSNMYLSKFSNLTRKILECSENESILIEEEIEMLKLYLELEKLRFGNEFRYDILIDQGVKIHSMSIPSLILQPFVENAIKHGLLHKKGDKLCEIRFSLHANGLNISVFDNGVGRKRSEEIKNRKKTIHRSFATGAVQKRIDLLNVEKKDKIRIEIMDLIDKGESCGTRVEVFIPFNFMN